MDLHLKDKIVIVTGGTSGIGEAIVHAFAREEAQVVFVGRSQDKAERIKNELKSSNHDAHFIQADLTEEKACINVIDETIQKFGSIDVLVNNAGINDKVGLEASPGEFMQSIQKNLYHYFVLVHYAREKLIQNKGNIVNIGSKVANTGQGHTSGYAASKGAIQALTREWAAFFSNQGVRVNEVIPAETWTPLYESELQKTPDPEATREAIAKMIPLEGRFTTSQEIAETVVFVASDRSSHTTGQHLYVDGGYTHLDRALNQ